MKRTFVLLTLVAALVAAPAFAETTFTGSVEFEYGTNFDDYSNQLDNDSDISLDGTVGDFTTISVGLEADEESLDASKAVTMSSATLEQNVTGALGIEGPVSFTYKMGKQDYSPEDYGKVNGYNAFEAGAGTSSSLSTLFTVGLMDMITVDTYVNLQSLIDEAPEFGVNVYGTVEMFSFSAYYVNSEDGVEYSDTQLKINGVPQVDADGEPIYELKVPQTLDGDAIGFNFALDFSPLKIGGIVESYLVDEDFYGVDLYTFYGVSAGYQITEDLSAGAAFQSSVYEESEFKAESCFGINVEYDVMDNLAVWGALKANSFEEIADNLGYEIGVETALDGVTYCVGWTDASDFKAYDAGIEDGSMFFKVSASF